MEWTKKKYIDIEDFMENGKLERNIFGFEKNFLKMFSDQIPANKSKK